MFGVALAPIFAVGVMLLVGIVLFALLLRK